MRAFAAALALWVAVAGPAAAVERPADTGIRPTAEGANWSGRQKRRLQRDLDALLDTAPTLRGAHVGLLAIDTRSGDVVYARKADDAFVPASTMKLLTGSVALALLGPQYRFLTTAQRNADGSLLVFAGGDPQLTSDNLAALAASAVAVGGFRASAGIAIDATRFADGAYPPGWSWDDFIFDYAAALTPLPVDENALTLDVRPGRAAGDPPRVQGLDDVRCAGAVLPSGSTPATTGAAGSELTLDVAGAGPLNCPVLIGSIPLDAEPQTIGIARPDPAGYPLRLLRRAAADAEAGHPSAAISTSWGRIGSQWSHAGEPLSDLLADMWWPSDNFIAEMLLRAIGLHSAGAPGTTAHGTIAETAWLTSVGVDPGTLTIVDGSGLSTYDRLTPRALVAILQADWSGPNRDVVIDDLPLAGVRGTLASAFAGSLAARRTFAKTGSVSHARGLAGYLATQRHGAITIAWSVDDWMGKNDDLNALRARVLSRIIGD